MKVVILAAGKGTRLEEVNLPKPLTLLSNGKSILELQLENIGTCLSLDQVIIAVGYRKEVIMQHFPDLLYVYNPCFATENTAKSLLRALKKVNEDVIWINGDVVFHHDVLYALISRGKTAMVVNVGPVGEEEMKYRKDPQGKIIEVSKDVKNPCGEAMGINLFREDDLDLLKKNLALCADEDFFEKAIERCIAEGLSVWSLPVTPSQCTEIDFPQDLQKANKMLEGWS
jgi:L-glutamine-phosphate cytidylyltransferase